MSITYLCREQREHCGSCYAGPATAFESCRLMMQYHAIEIVQIESLLVGSSGPIMFSLLFLEFLLIFSWARDFIIFVNGWFTTFLLFSSVPEFFFSLLNVPNLVVNVMNFPVHFWKYLTTLEFRLTRYVEQVSGLDPKREIDFGSIIDYKFGLVEVEFLVKVAMVSIAGALLFFVSRTCLLVWMFVKHHLERFARVCLRICGAWFRFLMFYVYVFLQAVRDMSSGYRRVFSAYQSVLSVVTNCVQRLREFDLNCVLKNYYSGCEFAKRRITSMLPTRNAPTLKVAEAGSSASASVEVEGELCVRGSYDALNNDNKNSKEIKDEDDDKSISYLDLVRDYNPRLRKTK